MHRMQGLAHACTIKSRETYVLPGPNDLICQYSLNEQQSPTAIDFLILIVNSALQSIQFERTLIGVGNVELESNFDIRTDTFFYHEIEHEKSRFKHFDNRFLVLNGNILLDWFNGSLESLKVKCKKLLL